MPVICPSALQLRASASSTAKAVQDEARHAGSGALLAGFLFGGVGDQQIRRCFRLPFGELEPIKKRTLLGGQLRRLFGARHGDWIMLFLALFQLGAAVL